MRQTIIVPSASIVINIAGDEIRQVRAFKNESDELAARFITDGTQLLVRTVNQTLNEYKPGGMDFKK